MNLIDCFIMNHFYKLLGDAISCCLLVDQCHSETDTKPNSVWLYVVVRSLQLGGPAVRGTQLVSVCRTLFSV